MATTSYRCRAIIKEFSGDSTATLDAVDFSGTYKLMMKSKSMPAPVSAPNSVESTTLEDKAQTFEEGIQTSDSKEFTGNLEKEYLDNLGKLEGKRVCLFQLYGTQGVGEVAKYCYVAQVSASPSDVGGVDEIVEMTATVIPNSVARKVTDDYTIVDNKDGTFTVTKATV